jgi:hypothetical protein
MGRSRISAVSSMAAIALSLQAIGAQARRVIDWAGNAHRSLRE